MKKNLQGAASGNETPDKELPIGEVPGVGAAQHFPVLKDDSAEGNAENN